MFVPLKVDVISAVPPKPSDEDFVRKESESQCIGKEKLNFPAAAV